GGAGQDGDDLQHGLAAVTKARRFDYGALDDATHVVHHQGGQRFAFHVLGNDQQRLAGLGNGFQHRQQFADVGDLLVDQQDVRVLKLNRHLFLVVDEVRAQVAAVELHAFNHFQLVLQAATFFHGDNTVGGELAVTVGYFFHGVGDDVAHGAVAVGRNRSDLFDRLAIFYRRGQLFQLFHDSGHGLVDAALQVHRVHAG